MSHYGESPVEIGGLDLPMWQEFMHYLYLPVRIPEGEGFAAETNRDLVLPKRLWFLKPAVEAALRDSASQEHLSDPYVYLTAKRGFAHPGHPLNRPGWHCDDFGGTDLNYVWCDAFPTLALLSDKPLDVPDDDAESMVFMQDCADMTQYAAENEYQMQSRIEHMETNVLYRLSPYVIHAAPEISAPGGMRSFFKISISTHRYDLIGNSHNHLLNYDWPMYSREELRNQPSGGNKDYSGKAES